MWKRVQVCVYGLVLVLFTKFMCLCCYNKVLLHWPDDIFWSHKVDFNNMMTNFIAYQTYKLWTGIFIIKISTTVVKNGDFYFIHFITMSIQFTCKKKENCFSFAFNRTASVKMFSGRTKFNGKELTFVQKFPSADYDVVKDLYWSDISILMVFLSPSNFQRPT